MRKTVMLLALLLAVMLAAAGSLPLGVPGNLLPGPARTPDNEILAAENRLLVSRIYTLRSGVISQLYEELRVQDGKECGIARVAAEKQNVYFLRAFADGVNWQLMKLENGAAVSVEKGAFEQSARMTGLTALNGTVWITAMHTDGTVSVYECGSQGSGLKLLMPAQWTEDVVTAEFDGAQLRATTGHGDHCFIAQDGKRTYSEAAAEAAAPKLVEHPVGWLLGKRTALAAALILWLVIALSILITVTINRKATRLATRLTAAGGEIIFLMLLAAMGLVSYRLLLASGPLEMLENVSIMTVVAAEILLLGVLLLRVVSLRMTKPLPDLVRQMDEVTEGRVDFHDVAPGKDELHRMDQAMQEMCMSLSIRNYELESTIRSYQRFVPEKLTELLDRAAVAEVSLGDSRRMTSNIGLFSVGNRSEARNVLDDDAFVDFINHSLDIFQNCLQENHGSMISSGLRLSAMETMFPDSAADGVQAGLDFLGRAQKKYGEGIPSPQPFLILHRASVLYGVAGQAERLFPYLSSGEMEFLGSFAQQFHQVGVRIVMTESYKKQLEDQRYNVRYIGFVADGFTADGDRGAYKLYEVLDAYPELERKLRIGYDQRFQEAINLFYRNDFFLARNLFSTLLRTCPEDGIARWYLFACEHYFNQEGSCEADYQLFGIREE